jgi:pimeloyl-ACP methyl ester carboxylesterase
MTTTQHAAAPEVGRAEQGAGTPPGDFVRAGGVPIHYVRRGAGRPVVYVHGAKSSVYDFTLSIADRVAERYTAVAFDRPGSGFSGRPAQDGGRPQAQAAVLREAARALGLERPVLVGHSLGAAVALAWALETPSEVAAVVTLGGYVLPLGGPPRWVVATMRSAATMRAVGRLGRSPLGRPFVTAALRRVFSPDEPPEAYARLAPALALEPSRLVHDGADRRAAEDGLRELARGYGELEVPVVVVVGEADRAVPPESSYALHRLLPRSELVTLPATGHMPHFTRPDAVVAAVDRAVDLAGG